MTIRYDTVDLRALRSWRDGQLNLAHGPETKNNGKNKNQKPSSSGETVQAKVRGGSPGGRRETKGVGFVKEVGLSWEWKRDGVIDVQSGESDEEDVVGGKIGEKEMEELVPEWGLRRDKGSWFQRQGAHTVCQTQN